MLVLVFQGLRIISTCIVAHFVDGYDGSDSVSVNDGDGEKEGGMGTREGERFSWRIALGPSELP